MKHTEKIIVGLFAVVVVLAFANTFFIGDLSIKGNYDSALDSQNSFKDSTSKLSGDCSPGGNSKKLANGQTICCPPETPPADHCQGNYFVTYRGNPNGCGWLSSSSCSLNCARNNNPPRDTCLDSLTIQYWFFDSTICDWYPEQFDCYTIDKYGGPWSCEDPAPVNANCVWPSYPQDHP